MDLASAYWAVPIREEDREKTAFMTPHGLLEMCVTGYGLCNSQATYQRLIDEVTKDVPNSEGFIDDISNYTKEFREMMKNLRQLFIKLREYNLQIRADKCFFGYYEIDFLGYHISSKGIAPTETLIKDMLAVPEPKNKNELERFLGMVGYYRQFIENMSQISEPLNRLRRKGQAYVWDEECAAAFLKLKECLSTSPVLIYLNWSKPFYLEGDASDVAVGSVLSQFDENSKILRPIGYASYSLKPEQKNYGPGEKECFSLIAAARKWKKYCRAATQLYFITDHEPLKWLRERKDPHGKYARWMAKLEELNYKILPRNGKDHVVPDCLSRIENPSQDNIAHDDAWFFDNRLFAISLEDGNMVEEQMKDPAIAMAIRQLQEYNEIRQGRYKRFKNMSMKNGVLMRDDKIVLPISMRYEITNEVHRNMGLSDYKKTIDIVSAKYTWVGLHEYIRDFCSHCDICLKNKSDRSPKVPIHDFAPLPSKPREQIAFDVATLPWASNNHRYFLLIIARLRSLCGTCTNEKSGSHYNKGSLDAVLGISPWKFPHGFK